MNSLAVILSLQQLLTDVRADVNEERALLAARARL
jgi:hypothetical protein